MKNEVDSLWSFGPLTSAVLGILAFGLLAVAIGRLL